MVYSNKFIAVIKYKGKVLREFSDTTVRLPFGSDYSILLKNKDMRSALVNIKVDGKDVLDGNSIIVVSNETTELKGFMKGSKVKNKFRFINKTKEISNYRGDFLEDGLVEISYRFEKQVPINWTIPVTYTTEVYEPRANCFYSHNIGTAGKPASYGSINASCSVNDSGITVPGMETNQTFVAGYIGDLESCTYNIIIHLKGNIESKAKRKRVNKPITVKTKIRCSTCGRRWKSSMKYCGNCSTYLH